MSMTTTDSRAAIKTRANDVFPENLKKRSFLKLPVEIDVDALLREYTAIPREAWSSSHWDVHCSTNMFLLRGGQKGTAEDFTTSQVENNPLLSQLPYMASLVDPGGPFGECEYAFILRMKPMGVSRVHYDNDPAWEDPFRIHIPITSNPEAVLIAEKMAKHLEVGEVWTFDNQSMHSVSNGDSVRAHLILDVNRNPKLEELLKKAEYDPGGYAPELWQRTDTNLDVPRPMALADSEPLSVTEKDKLGLDPEGFASRITSKRLIAKLTGARIRGGDILVSVNGVEACAVARTATDYIQIRHMPGETLELGILRNGECRRLNVKLFKNSIPEPVMVVLRFVKSAVRG